jgi:hypothetical protein
MKNRATALLKNRSARLTEPEHLDIANDPTWSTWSR